MEEEKNLPSGSAILLNKVMGFLMWVFSPFLSYLIPAYFVNEIHNSHLVELTNITLTLKNTALVMIVIDILLVGVALAFIQIYLAIKEDHSEHKTNWNKLFSYVFLMVTYFCHYLIIVKFYS